MKLLKVSNRIKLVPFILFWVCAAAKCYKLFSASCSPAVFGKSVSVTEGESITLNSNVTKIHNNEDIQWKFGAEKSLIAEISKAAGIFSTFDGPDGRFRDGLKLDKQTGSLTIMNITNEHAGVYKLLINGAKRLKKTFSVSVYGEWRSFLLSFRYSCYLNIKGDSTSRKEMYKCTVYSPPCHPRCSCLSFFSCKEIMFFERNISGFFSI
ncbi:Secreted and transmembrane protein 1 [Labeo rohita]|uniref:Secreted and transmembrane protein 1 n=1 Tax=Labeo rohita TaxID=84645 RepID=A0ABQ8L2H6_LABRO|nr:Secreted and transmembrane protein 1 [Labeo rohita]